jgi:hypothetical protein
MVGKHPVAFAARFGRRAVLVHRCRRPDSGAARRFDDAALPEELLDRGVDARDVDVELLAELLGPVRAEEEHQERVGVSQLRRDALLGQLVFPSPPYRTTGPAFGFALISEYGTVRSVDRSAQAPVAASPPKLKVARGLCVTATTNARRSCYAARLPKPAPRVVKLPDGGEVIPEQFHEGRDATRRFQGSLQTILGMSRVELEKRHTAWEQSRARVKRALR